MIKLQQLTSENHHNIKVEAMTGASPTDQIHMVHITPGEYALCARHYPIFLIKDPETGQFNTVALFGLSVDENLFIEQGQWHHVYLPLQIQSQPFFIRADPQATTDLPPALCIDINNPRVQTSAGEALFNNGKATPYLQQVANKLGEMTKGFVANTRFIDALLEHNLVEAIELDIKLDNGQSSHLTGLYTINKDNLVKVPKEAQQQFEQFRYVELIDHLMTAPNQVKALITRKNQRNAFQQFSTNK